MKKKIDIVSLRFGRDLGKCPPLGPLILAGISERCEWEWKLFDCQDYDYISPFSVDAFVDLLAECEGQILAISLFNDAIPLLIAAFDRLGDKFASRTVIMGGPGVVGIAEDLLNRIQCLDAVVVGEGETTLKRLLERGTITGGQGVFTRDGRENLSGFGRTPRENLDELPQVPWDWCKGRGYRAVPLSTMRGCPYDCSFCEIIAFMGRKVSKRDVNGAIEDLQKACDELGLTNVDVFDDTFTLSKSRVMAICEAIRGMSYPIRFSIFSRIDTIDHEMMDALAKAGCCKIFFGVDSGDDAVLSNISKRIDASSAERTVCDAAEFFDVTASFIWGYPFESRESFDHTVAMAQRFLEHDAKFKIQPQFHLLSPSAGTPLFEQYGEYLVLDLENEGSTCGTIEGFSFEPDYEEVISVIKENHILAAPFYRYRTPEFSYKNRTIQELNRKMDIEAGGSIIDFLESKITK
ncbi:MAG: radical SAM protein [Planctomycetaceae bacterium]